MKLVVCFVMALLLPSYSWSISEKNFPETFREVVVPFVESKLEKSFFQNSINRRVFAAKLKKKNAVANLLLLSGRTEDHRKYYEKIYDFHQLNYNIYIMDWIGQGASDHLSSVNPTYGHIEDFNVYANDIELLLRHFDLQDSELPLYAIAHSMGANAASIACAKNPKLFDRLVLSSPMLDIHTNPFPEKVAYYLLKLLEFLGFGEHKAPMQKDFNPNEINKVTSSEVRRSVYFASRREKEEFIIAPTTTAFARAALEATWEMREHAQKLDLPILMLQAGKDRIVKTGGQDFVCRHAPNCLKVRYEDGMHELFQEQDVIRDDVLKQVDKFFKDGL